MDESSGLRPTTGEAISPLPQLPQLQEAPPAFFGQASSEGERREILPKG